MITVNNVSLRFGKRTLFENVNLKFVPGNCYGLIGANGAGKSTFLKLLSGEIETTTGDISIGKDERLSILKQDHNIYNDFRVLDVVIMGNKKLYDIMEEKNKLYMKSDFTDKDGIRLGELESEFADLNGWQAESDAAILLTGLGVDLKYHEMIMNDIPTKEKVKVLLAQALFGNPDILLLDEPTNGLDIEAKMWLEEFLIDFNNTIIVVSHDRHFLNKVCTHIVDIDYEKITLFVGNYDFWYKSSELIQKQMKESNKKKEEKIKELQDFIARFSANASKSKQATSRKKLLDKIVLEDIKPSSRKYPYISFKEDKPIGKDVLTTKNLCVSVDGVRLINNLNLTINNYDKIALIGNEIIITTLFKVLNGEIKPDSGEIKYGSSVISSYFPKNHDNYFTSNKNLVDWLREYSKNDDNEFVRGFLGRMLFSGEEVLKKVNVLSGGEKVRCMLSKMMLSGANFLMLDQPTDHLDVETITSLNNALIAFNGPIIFSTHDHEFIETTANRIIDFKDDGKYVDKMTTYEEYLKLKK
ncbi:MAG: ATP-binding cassette domain-containing protein [Bacilli bacterium]|nr:ATP-binding cassette domain-containing protein [Bacilli bacterium]MBQ6282803.1 ATP-binding cassette domain-containing protein [Bacilli bacterium]